MALSSSCVAGYRSNRGQKHLMWHRLRLVLLVTTATEDRNIKTVIWHCLRLVLLVTTTTEGRNIKIVI